MKEGGAGWGAICAAGCAATGSSAGRVGGGTKRKRTAAGGRSCQAITRGAALAGVTASSSCAASMRARPGASEGAKVGANFWKPLSAKSNASRAALAGEIMGACAMPGWCTKVWPLAYHWSAYSPPGPSCKRGEGAVSGRCCWPRGGWVGVAYMGGSRREQKGGDSLALSTTGLAGLEANSRGGCPKRQEHVNQSLTKLQAFWKKKVEEDFFMGHSQFSTD